MTTNPHFAALRREYRPYDQLPAFNEGLAAYTSHTYRNPYDGVSAQAWDRGLECAMRWTRWLCTRTGEA
jgi:hypothetical protein